LQTGEKEWLIMAMDPVCHMEVDEKSAQWTSEHEGKTYYFCAPGCKASFDKDPEKYLGHSEEEHDHDHHHHH
jgi:YHS domain-containing protein